MISAEDLSFASRNLHLLGPAEKEQVLKLLEERERVGELTEAREHFLPFVKRLWPDFIQGAHHVIMGEAFERVANGQTKRLIINIAPRHGKSELASVMLPAWFLGKFPRKKIIEVSNTESLASGFGRRVRNILNGEGETNGAGKTPYQEIFPGVDLAKDSQASAEWHTNVGGEYFAVGVNGRVTGKGADIAIVDDPHDEQQARQAESTPEIFDGVYSWYTSGIRQRLQPGGAIIIVMTRWSQRDLTGQLVRKMKSRTKDEFGDTWEVIELPAILDEGEPTERPMWPGFWSLKELQNTREEIGPLKFKSQYQQAPTSEVAAIIKRDYWQIWGKDTDEDVKMGRSSCPGSMHRQAWNDLLPPACDFVLHSWDPAATKNERSHPSAFTSWGVFMVEDRESGRTIPNLILLSAMKRRMEFPELKKTVKEYYDEDQPDELLIENKSAGMQLIQEFRSMGLPVQDFSGSSRGKSTGVRGVGTNDKTARLNMVADIFASHYVWIPDRRYAWDVVAQMAEYPNSAEGDDLLDSAVQAMLRFRQGGFIRTANDEQDEESAPRRRKRMY